MSDIWSDLWRVREMEAWLTVVAESRAARSAPIPNLVEIRRMQCLREEAAQNWLDALAEDWHALYFTLRCGCRRTTTLIVHENDRPLKSPPRGFCSPVKTAETRQFETLVQRVFPEAQSATTEWRDNN